MRKTKILKAAGILLIAAVMTLSSTAVAASTSFSSQSVNKEKSSMGALGDELLLDEGFEDGIMPPDDWEVIIEDEDYTWDITNDPDWVHSGDYAAFVPKGSPDPPDQDEWLISPEIDLTHVSEACLTFWASTYTSSSDWTMLLHIMGEGFDDVIWDCIDEEEWFDGLYHEKNFNLTGYCNQIIQIAWQSVGIHNRVFYLDDIKVFGEPVSDPANLTLRDVKGIIPLTLTAEIKNIGNGTAENVDWSITIKGKGVIRKINESANGTIATIEPDSLEVVQLNPIYGFCKVNITITAVTDDPRVEPINKSFDGFLFFVIIVGIK